MKTTLKSAPSPLATLTLARRGAVFAHPGMGYGMGYAHGPGARPGQWAYGMGRERVPTWAWTRMRGPMQGRRTPAAVGARRAAEGELKITAAQEGAWNAYAAVVQQQAEQRLAQRADAGPDAGPEGRRDVGPQRAP